MGKVVALKKHGKNLETYAIRARDGYYVYSARRTKLNGKEFSVSSATAYPRSKADAIKAVKESNAREVFALHPALRDEGTSMTPPYNYKLQKGRNKRKLKSVS